MFGIAPALRATRTDVNAGAQGEQPERRRPHAACSADLLVVAQVAISLVLLVGAGLFLRTLQNLRQVDVGFNPRNVLLFRVNPTLNRYDSRKASACSTIRSASASGHSPACVRSSWSNLSLMSARRFSRRMFVQGRTYARGQRDVYLGIGVSPTFFETMEIPLLCRPRLHARDTQDAPRVAVINEAAARKYFPNESPIGRRIGSTLEGSGRQEIVGILRDAKYNGVREAGRADEVHSFRAGFSGQRDLRECGRPAIRSTSVDAVRDAVDRSIPTLPLTNVTTQLEEVEGRFLQEKVFAQAYTLFGGLALLVASIGLFGVMSYSVARRTNEIGIRMTLGARDRTCMGLVMRESLILVAAGVAIGIGAAIAASRLVASLLFGLTPTDPMAMAGAMTVMLVVSALAGYLPARRASKRRSDGGVALRVERQRQEPQRTRSPQKREIILCDLGACQAEARGS